MRSVGWLIDNAMEAIERENEEKLKNVLNKDFAHTQIDSHKLADLIAHFSDTVVEDEEDIASREKTKSEWAALEKLVGAEPRLAQVAKDPRPPLPAAWSLALRAVSLRPEPATPSRPGHPDCSFRHICR